MRRSDGTVVRGPEQVQPGELLELSVARGLIAARVELSPADQSPADLSPPDLSPSARGGLRDIRSAGSNRAATSKNPVAKNPVAKNPVAKNPVATNPHQQQGSAE